MVLLLSIPLHFCLHLLQQAGIKKANLELYEDPANSSMRSAKLNHGPIRTVARSSCNSHNVMMMRTSNEHLYTTSNIILKENFINWSWLAGRKWLFSSSFLGPLLRYFISYVIIFSLSYFLLGVLFKYPAKSNII